MTLIMIRCLFPSSSIATTPQVFPYDRTQPCWLQHPVETYTWIIFKISLISLIPAGLSVYSKNLSNITQSFLGGG